MQKVSLITDSDIFSFFKNILLLLEAFDTCEIFLLEDFFNIFSLLIVLISLIELFFIILFWFCLLLSLFISSILVKFLLEFFCIIKSIFVLSFIFFSSSFSLLSISSFLKSEILFSWISGFLSKESFIIILLSDILLFIFVILLSVLFSSILFLIDILLFDFSLISIELIFWLILEISLFCLSIFIFCLLSFSILSLFLISLFSLFFWFGSKIFKRFFKLLELLIWFLNSDWFVISFFSSVRNCWTLLFLFVFELLFFW